MFVFVFVYIFTLVFPFFLSLKKHGPGRTDTYGWSPSWVAGSGLILQVFLAQQLCYWTSWTLKKSWNVFSLFSLPILPLLTYHLSHSDRTYFIKAVSNCVTCSAAILMGVITLSGVAPCIPLILLPLYWSTFLFGLKSFHISFNFCSIGLGR